MERDDRPVAVTLAVPVLNVRVVLPTPAIPRSPNLAKPWASVVAVPWPCSVPGPVATVAVTLTPTTGFPPASLTWTTGCTEGSNTSLSSADEGGLVVSRTVLPVLPEMVMPEEIAGITPVAAKRRL